MTKNDVSREPELVVVGSIGLDDIATPFEKKTSLLGGSVSYACAAASLFARVGMVGVVGDDFPEPCMELYRAFGIDLEGLQRVSGKTFRWSGEYEDDMINRRTIFTDLNVFEHFSPKLPEAYCRAPFVLLGNISPELQLNVLSQASGAKFVLADTMDLWINIARDALMEVIGKVHMLTVNDSEARLLTGLHGLRQCAEKILEWGPQYVVIKKGEHGAMLVSRDGIFLAPAYPIDCVMDPTGAGDAFAGAFMGGLVRDDVSAMRSSLLLGAVVASFAVEAFSLDRLASLQSGEIEKRLGLLCEMIRV